jgi:D-lactate dehydrogenase
MGTELTGKTIGVLGVGKIGFCFAKIAKGFGCRILGYDLRVNPAYAETVEYLDLDELLPQCDIVCIFLPLFPSTKHLINEQRLALMKPGAYLVNVGRGGVIDSKALIRALKARRLSGVALDVYEFETHIFMQDFSEHGVSDDILTRLLSWPYVIVTPHIAFFTQSSVEAIFTQSCLSLKQFLGGEQVERALRAEVVAAK